MKSQSLKASSSLSPSAYLLRENEQGYGFTTDYGVDYLIALTSDRELLPDEPFALDLFSFSVVSLTEGPPVGDPRVEITVIEILNRLYAVNPQLIVSYVCSLEDGQERSRRILFGRWFRQHGAGYVRPEFTDVDSRIYAAVIYNAEHPRRAAIDVAFNREYRNK